MYNEIAEVNDSNADVPYIIYENSLARAERQIKRLWIVLVIAIIAIVACNVVWMWYINQYDFESYTISTDGGGDANYIGQDGDIYNGTNNSSQAS